MLTCVKVVLIGFVLPYTPIDETIIRAAKAGCYKRFRSCPVKIEKQGPDKYHITCEDLKNGDKGKG